MSQLANFPARHTANWFAQGAPTLVGRRITCNHFASLDLTLNSWPETHHYITH